MAPAPLADAVAQGDECADRFGATPGRLNMR